MTHAGGEGGGAGGWGGGGEGGGGDGGSGGGDGGPRQMVTSDRYMVAHGEPGGETILTVMKLLIWPGKTPGVGALAPMQLTTKGPAFAGAVMIPFEPGAWGPHRRAPVPVSPKEVPTQTWKVSRLPWNAVRSVLWMTM